MGVGALPAFKERFDHLRALSRHWAHCGGPVTAVALAVAGGLAFEAVTPQIISVGIFYVGAVLIGFWFPKPKAALALALLVTSLIVAGYWIAIPDNTTAWQAWLNRALAIGTVWMTAIFVWHIRVLEQRLQQQVEITERLSSEMSHRIGNHLQFVGSFLRLHAASSRSDESRRALELAGSRVMVIGNIQRMLSHSTPSHMVDARAFITALVGEVRSALPDPDRVGIVVRADSAELTSTTAIAIGTLLVELINNALKHAFRDSMTGMITVGFTVSETQYLLECEDDGVGIGEKQPSEGFGMQSVSALARLIGGSITCQPARRSSSPPGTIWRLAIPAR
jgi:two-component sensor histidine kinase